MDYERIIIFEEPHPTGGDCRIEITVGKAIKWFRETYPMWKKPTSSYFSDERAVEEFMILFHAWYKDKEK